MEGLLPLASICAASVMPLTWNAASTYQVFKTAFHVLAQLSWLFQEILRRAGGPSSFPTLPAVDRPYHAPLSPYR